MDTISIKKLFRYFKCFNGVFSCDKLPYKERLPINLIANTDPSYLPGKHWIGISINKKGRGIYFDSFGLPPINEDLYNFMESKCKKGWSYNKTQIQNINSTTCGNYCVLFIIHSCQGISFKNFISVFHRNTIQNEKRIKAIFKNYSLVKKFLY